MALALMSGMNVIAQKITEFSSSQQLNAKPDLNPRGKVYYDKFTFDSLFNNMKSNDTLKLAGIRQQNGYSENGRIDRRQEQPDRYKEIDGREYNRRPDEVNGKAEQSDGQRKIAGRGYNNGPEQKDELAGSDDKNTVRDVFEAEKDEDTPGENKAKEDGSGTRGLLDGKPVCSQINQGEAAANEEAGGEDNNAAPLLSDTVDDGKSPGVPGSLEGTGDDLKTGQLLNTILLKSANTKINPAKNENTEAVNSALTGPDNNIKEGALLSETPDESEDKKGAANLVNLITQAKAESTDPDDAEAVYRDIPEQSGKDADSKKNMPKKLNPLTMR